MPHVDGLEPQAMTELHRLVQESIADRENRWPDLRWAERIVQRHRAGEQLSPTTLKMAQDALAGKGLR